MYRAYMVPDATQFRSRAEMYQAKLLLWDPRSESDAYAIIGPKLKIEMNKAEGVEFTVLPSNIRYNQFHKKISVVMIYDDDEWIFEGVVSDCPRDFYKQMKVTCSGPLSYLCDSVQAPDENNEITVPTASGQTYVQVSTQWYNNANPRADGWYERSSNPDVSGHYTYTLSRDTVPVNGKRYYYLSSGDGENYSGTTYTKKAGTKETIGAHLSRMLDVHNSQVEPYKVIRLGRCIGDTTEHEFKSSNYRETWSAIKSDIIEQYGRYVTIRIDDHYELNFNYLELRDMDPHTTPEATIEFTENMIEMSESDDSDDDIFTVLVPIGKNSLTVSGVSGHDSPEYNDNRYVDPYIGTWGGNRRYVLVSRYALGRYGIIVKTQTFSDADTADKLWTEAVKYIKNNFDAHVEYEVKGIDAHILDPSKSRIIVGKKCRVKSGWHGVDEKELFVISAEHDLLSPDNDSYKIGIPTSDREAMNKTLTGQTTSASTSSKNSASNLSSAVNNIASWLENYFTENEGWLELHNKFRNQVESDNGMFMTRFQQDEEHINLVAQKIFGVAGSDDVDNQDAGWILIPKPPYRKSGQGVEDYYETSNPTDTRYKVPSEHNWYVKGADGKYTLSTQDTRVTQAQVNDSNVNFYIMRLATRYSDLDVGPQGIKGRVDGNYERSIASSSWIHANEDSITALTGHIFVDEDGHARISSGDGMRSDHQENPTDQKRFMLVPSTMYKDVHGNDVKPNWSTGGRKWYEKKVDTSGAWVGLDKEDAYTNAAYFVYSQDETVNRSKSYYYLSYIREEFRSEFGVYDEDNLTAGIIVRSINNPTYHRVSKDRIDDAIKNGTHLAQLMWYVYDNNTGLYGVPLDQTAVPSMALYKSGEGYYERVSNDQTYTNVMGDHVVIGGRLDENGNPIIFDGVDEATQARIQQYIHGHNLDGTITEVASDVLYAKAIITNYINVLSTKLFGENNDDSDFVVVKAAGVSSSKNPSANGWYEYSAETGKYFLSADAKAVTSKTYYITKLTSRTTDFEVGEGGLQATIKGNYDRSIASQAWIKANEEKLEMLLGHVGEDENGNLVIDSGAGFKTGHSAASTVTPRYVLVLRSKYAGANPKSLGWKERKIGADGRWVGAGKADSDTNASYYVTTSDTSADYTKQYFIQSTTAESYISEYGVYDQGNLTAGVVAQMVNNPKYHAIERKYQSANVNPSTASSVKLSNGSTVNSMWYVYDSEHGTYGRTTDTSLVPGRVYYYVQNSTSTYTDLRGEHIVIGTSDGYSGLDAATKTRVNKYIHEHNLDGTITEIASDVVVVNTLIAKYIDVDEITVNTWLAAESGHFSKLRVGINAEISDLGDGDLVANWGYFDFLSGGHVNATSLTFAPIGSGVGFGYSGGNDVGVDRLANPSDIVMGFGTITTTGDTVKIPYTTLYDFCNNETDASHVLSFDKPASLGTVTWSSGEKLTVKTAGGKTFFTADLLIPKIYSGDSVSYAKDVNGNIAPNTLLRNKHILSATMDVTGTWTDLQLDPEEDDPVVWTATIYFDATKAYNTGYDTGYGSVGTYCEYDDDNDGEAEGHSSGSISLNYSDSVTVYGRHQPVGGAWRNAGTNDRITIKSPADRYETGKSDGRSGTSISAPASATAPQGATVTDLSYGTTYEVHKVFGGNSDGGTVYFKAPPNNDATVSGRTYAKYGDTEYTSGTIALGYSDSVTVKGQYKKNDGAWTDAASIKVTSPASDATSHSIDIPSKQIYTSDTARGTKLTTLKSNYETAKADGDYVMFRVDCGGESKWYYMEP